MIDFTDRVESLVGDILADSASEQEALGHLMLSATHFIGSAAAVLRRISEKKGGPALDIAGWSEEITKMIIADSKRQLRQ
jgi:hypothetical protein